MPRFPASRRPTSLVRTVGTWPPCLGHHPQAPAGHGDSALTVPSRGASTQRSPEKLNFSSPPYSPPSKHTHALRHTVFLLQKHTLSAAQFPFRLHTRFALCRSPSSANTRFPDIRFPFWADTRFKTGSSPYTRAHACRATVPLPDATHAL